MDFTQSYSMLKFDWLCQHSGRWNENLAHVTRRIFPSLPPPHFPAHAHHEEKYGWLARLDDHNCCMPSQPVVPKPEAEVGLPHMHFVCVEGVVHVHGFLDQGFIQGGGGWKPGIPPPPPKNFKIDKVNNQCNEIQIRC